MSDKKAISSIIRQRVIDSGKGFYASQNIAEFIEEGEMDLLFEEVKGRVDDLLKSLVIDTENDHNTNDTPRRVAKMYLREVFRGRYEPAPVITSFPNVGIDEEEPYDGIYVTGPITIRSTCAHHFQNITGQCFVGVMPDQNVIGLSKFNRVVDHICSRPQIQEEMCMQIAKAASEVCDTDDIAVLIKAEHHCMSHRGVREHAPSFRTPIMRGMFRNNSKLRNEFYQLVAMK